MTGTQNPHGQGTETDFPDSPTYQSAVRSDMVQAEIERMILAGELRAGDHIGEQALADRLDVSRGPVREACRALQRARMVEIVPNKGVFVRRVGLEDVLEVFEIRAHLASIAAMSAIDEINRRMCDEMRDLIERMDETVPVNDADRYLELNLRFHNRIFEVSGNRRLLEMEKDLAKEVRIFRRQALTYGGQLAERNDEHRRILEALISGDRWRATTLLHQHVRNGGERLLAALEADGSSMDVLDTRAKFSRRAQMAAGLIDSFSKDETRSA